MLLLFTATSISAQTDFISELQIDTSNLTSSQNILYHKITAQDYILNTRFVDLGDLRTMQADGWLDLKHPDKDCTTTVKAKHVESDSTGNYYWFGEVQKVVTDSTAEGACDCYTGHVVLMKRDSSTIGTISIDDDTYHLEDLGEGRNLLVKKDTDVNLTCGIPDLEAVSA